MDRDDLWIVEHCSELTSLGAFPSPLHPWSLILVILSSLADHTIACCVRHAIHEEPTMEAFVPYMYDERLADHIEELVRQYPSKVVAVHKGHVVYRGDSERIGKTNGILARRRAARTVAGQAPRDGVG